MVFVSIYATGQVRLRITALLPPLVWRISTVGMYEAHQNRLSKRRNARLMDETVTTATAIESISRTLRKQQARRTQSRARVLSVLPEKATLQRECSCASARLARNRMVAEMLPVLFKVSAVIILSVYFLGSVTPTGGVSQTTGGTARPCRTRWCAASHGSPKLCSNTPLGSSLLRPRAWLLGSPSRNLGSSTLPLCYSSFRC